MKAFFLNTRNKRYDTNLLRSGSRNFSLLIGVIIYFFEGEDNIDKVEKKYQAQK